MVGSGCQPSVSFLWPFLCLATISNFTYFLSDCLLFFSPQNTRHKFYGFDLLTDDDKVFYPLAADTESEMEEWTSILTRAIGLEMEGTDSVPGEGGREGGRNGGKENLGESTAGKVLITSIPPSLPSLLPPSPRHQRAPHRSTSRTHS